MLHNKKELSLFIFCFCLKKIIFLKIFFYVVNRTKIEGTTKQLVKSATFLKFQLFQTNLKKLDFLSTFY